MFKKPSIVTPILTITFSAYSAAMALLLASLVSETDFLMTDYELLYALIFFYIASAISFLVWTYRVSKNLQFLDVENLTLKPRWAIGWFFIPFANIVIPHDVFMQIWRGSAPPGSHPDQSEWLIKAWWWTYIFSGGTAIFSSTYDGPGPFYAASALGAFYLSLVLSIAAAIFAIVVVSKINHMQSARFTVISATNSPQT